MRNVTGPAPGSPVPLNVGVVLLVTVPLSGLAIVTLGAANAPGAHTAASPAPRSAAVTSRRMFLPTGRCAATHAPLLPLSTER